MSKFSKHVRPAKSSPIKSTAEVVTTAEGGVGFKREFKAELFLLAISNMGSEDTFYESARARDSRLATLVAEVTKADPAWVAGFVPYLRDVMQMRSSSVAVACEYVHAKGPHGRAVISAACARPDEPAEILGYWISKYGRKLPQPLKRGLADSCTRLYNERTSLKYDNSRSAIRMGDVIEMVHPKPSAPWQGELFKWLIDRRHSRAEPARVGPNLPMITMETSLNGMPRDNRRDLLRSKGADYLNGAGMSWERLSGWLPGGMDKEAWEAVAPNMGVMALLRNLRNFDEKGVSDEVAEKVIAKLTSPEDIRKARVFPLRFFSALKAVSSLRWHSALEKGIRQTLGNIPEMRGRTLVMVDNSGSMKDPLSGKSTVSRAQVAGLFAAAIVQRNVGSMAVSYDSQPLRAVEHQPGAAILVCADALGQALGGTNTWACTVGIYKKFGPFDRVIILTDEQHSNGLGMQMALRESVTCPVYTFNLAGYKAAGIESDGQMVTFGGGLTDSAFVMLAEIERAGDGKWPWMDAKEPVTNKESVS